MKIFLQELDINNSPQSLLFPLLSIDDVSLTQQTNILLKESSVFWLFFLHFVLNIYILYHRRPIRQIEVKHFFVLLIYSPPFKSIIYPDGTSRCFQSERSERFLAERECQRLL